MATISSQNRSWGVT